MDAHKSGASNSLESGALVPKVTARPTPAPAKSRLSRQLKNVTTCLRQCCSPSVNMILLGSALRSRMKRTALKASPIPP